KFINYITIPCYRHCSLHPRFSIARVPPCDRIGGRNMSVFDEFLSANEQYVQGFDRGDLPMPPRRHIAVLTCMEARLHPEKFLGLDVGDAHVIRNAGGRASQDAIRSLAISSKLLATQEFLVIHHSDCGMLTFSNDDLRGRLREETGKDAD